MRILVASVPLSACVLITKGDLDGWREQHPADSAVADTGETESDADADADVDADADADADADSDADDTGMAEVDLAGSAVRYSSEQSGDYAGVAVGVGGDLNGDGFDDLIVGAEHSNVDGRIEGAAYVVLGSATPLGGSLGAVGVRLAGEDADYAGAAVSYAGDVNRDGFGDVLVGALHNDGAGVYSGAAYLVAGSASFDELPLRDALAVYSGDQAGEYVGCPVAGAGDVNDDGAGDVVLGARGNGATGTDAGAAYVILGSSSPTDTTVADADAFFTGEAAGDWAGWSVAGAGDVDADGVDDLLIGAPSAGGGGSAYLELGARSFSSGGSLADADAIFIGDGGENAGKVADAGDVNGDGAHDILVGAYAHDRSTGAVYLVLGGASPASVDLAAADAIWLGVQEGDEAGTGVSRGGDVDGDGFEDVIIGAEGLRDAGQAVGGAYLVLGTASPGGGTLDGAAARYLGELNGDAAGHAVAGGGDVDGDGLDDMLVGTEANATGSAYLVLGPGRW